MGDLNMHRKTVVCIFTAVLVALPLSNAAPAVAADTLPTKLASGIDRAGFHGAVRPQDDFFRHVNGGWINGKEIPPDKSRWGSFDVLREASDGHQREIIEQLTAEKNLPAGSERKKIVDLY